MSKKAVDMTPEQLSRRRLLDRESKRMRYHADPAYREAVKARNYAYRKTPAGKIIDAKGHQKYYKTPKGRASAARKFEKRMAHHQYKELASVAVFKAGLSHQRASEIEAHHWSYLDEHVLDVIYLSLRDHRRLHRRMKEDPSTRKYIRTDTMRLMDNKIEHLDFIASLGISTHSAPNEH